MPADITIQGADEFQQVARQLREVGDKTLRRDFYRGIERAVKPMKEAARTAARTRLPQRGGLGQRVSRAKFKTKKRAGRDPGIKLTVDAGLDLEALDAGDVRHPVFGHRDRWVSQRVTARVISDAVEREADSVRRELLRVMDDVKRELSRG